MFGCLVDGIRALEYGYELQPVLAERTFVTVPLENLVPRVHFEQKPGKSQ
jgi:hypothetical protein